MNSIAPNLSQTATPEQNRDALQAALNTGAPVYIQRGVWPLAPGAQAALAGQVVHGDGQHASIFDCRGSGNFLSDGEWWGFEVRDLQLLGKFGGQNVTGGFGIVFDGSVGSNTSPGQMINCRIQRVLMDGMACGVYIRDQNNVIVDGLQMTAMQGDGIVCESPDANSRTDAVTLRDVIFSPTAEAVAAGRGTGLIIDGNVQTVDIENLNIVAPLRGIDVRNTAGLPFGLHAAFVFGARVKVDFPMQEAMRVAAVDRLRFSQSYFHGSKASNGVDIGGGARRAVFDACNVSGHFANGLVMRGYDLDVTGCDCDDNSQQQAGMHSGLLVMSAARAGVTGGSIGASPGAAVRTVWGIYRNTPAAQITVIGTRLQGTMGPKNF